MKATPTGFNVVSGKWDDGYNIINLDTLELNDLTQVHAFNAVSDSIQAPAESYQAMMDPVNKDVFTVNPTHRASPMLTIVKENYGGRAGSTETVSAVMGVPVRNELPQKVSPIWYALGAVAIYFYFFKNKRK